MSTENKPDLEIVTLNTTTTINHVPSSRVFHNLEDALKIVVSNTLVRKIFKCVTVVVGPHVNHQQDDSKKYW
jgi:hypothetical protein